MDVMTIFQGGLASWTVQVDRSIASMLMASVHQFAAHPLKNSQA